MKEEVIGTRYSPFWGQVTARSVTLITATECPASSVEEREAKELLSGAGHVTPQGAEPVTEQQEDADDLVRRAAGCVSMEHVQRVKVVAVKAGIMVQYCRCVAIVAITWCEFDIY